MTDKQKILVVDDDEFIQHLLSDTLDSVGFKTLIAKSAEECYRLLGSQIPDLFVLDIVLPGQDGFELCRNLRKNKSTLFTPVLMLSSKAKVQDRVKGLDAGADDFLVKPFHLDELVARVKALLRRTTEINRMESAKSAKTTDKVTDSKKTRKTDTTIKRTMQRSEERHTATPLIGPEVDTETRKKFATELFQQRQYEKALQMFEDLCTEDPKDLYSKKYREITRKSMMNYYLKALGSKNNVPVRTSDRPEDFIGLDFNSQEGFIFSRIDGVTSFNGIVSISGMKPVTAYGVLFNLFQSGVIEVKK